MAITGTSCTEAALLVTQNFVGIQVLHYLTMDDVFQCLAAYGGEGNRPLSGYSCLLS